MQGGIRRGGYLNVSIAQRWAREAGWSRGKDCRRWRSCVQARRWVMKARS